MRFSQRLGRQLLLALAIGLAIVLHAPVAANATIVPVNPFNSSFYDGSVHENAAYDYLVESCDGDTANGMTYSSGGVPVTDFPTLLGSTGGTVTNGCNQGSAAAGLVLAGTDGSTSGGTNTGVKGTWSLTAPAGTSITGLRYSDPLFVIPNGSGLISGWFGQLAGQSGTDLAAEHDPTQTYTAFENGIDPTYDCVTASPPSSCTVSNNSTDTFVFNTDPWTTSSSGQPALQKIALGFECRASNCDYDPTTYAGVGSALLQLDDPDGAPAAGPAGGGGARFNGQGVSTTAGWRAAGQVSGTTFSTANDAAGICSLAVGLYNASGDPVDVDQDSALQTPAVDSQTGYYTTPDPCSDPGSSATSQYTPDLAALAALPSGTYYLNAVAQNPAEYQQGVYSWYAGGLNTSHSSPAGAGIPVQIDNTVPQIRITGMQNGWSSGMQTITVSGTSGPSGVANLACADSGTAMAPASSTPGSDSETNVYTVPGNGIHAISCEVTSGVGTSATAQSTVQVDAGSPTVTFADSTQPTAGGWYSSAQSVAVTASEPDGLSGLRTLQCQQGTAAAVTSMTGSETVTLTGNGTHTISCQATTNAGVASVAETYTVKIDTTTPTVTIAGPPAGSYSSGEAVLDVSASDPGPSGVAEVECEQDDDSYSPIVLTNDAGKFDVTGSSGTHTVDCYALTGAGLSDRSSPQAYTVLLDDGGESSGSLTSYGSSPLIDNGDDPYSGGPSQTTWYSSAQQVTVTAQKSGGAAIANISCSGAGIQQKYPNTSTGPGEKVTVTVQPPGGMLSCTATDAAGNTYPLGSYRFQIDDTPPTGAFLGQDPSDLALVRVQASDSGSGVRKVEVSFICQSGACLDYRNGGPFSIQSEAATFDKSDGYWQAYIPDTGSWPDGDYALSTTMTDAAGNAGTTSFLNDGSTATIALPARLVTQISAKLVAAGGTATSQPDQVTPGAPGSLVRARNRVRHALTLRYGTAATLRGRLLERAGQIPIKRASVVIYERLTTSSKLTRVGSARTNRTGRFIYHLGAGASRLITVAYDGTAVLHPAATQITERFYGRIHIAVARQVVAGHVLLLRGQVEGGHIPAAGVLVQPRYVVAGLGSKWAPFGNAVRTSSTGRFEMKVKLAKVAAGLTYRLDVRVPTQAGYAFLTADSQTVRRRVAG